MSEEDKREERIFDAAIEIANRAERDAYLTEACGPDQQLRAKVEALLRHHEKSGIIDKPPFEAEVTLDDTPLTEGPGTKIGRYKLLELIGEGGFGVVYMAEQREPIRRRVALKIIKLGMDTKQVIARFEAERQALAMMEHPNIAKVLDAGATETGRPYFVMELVKGIRITEYCDKNNLDTRERLKLFIDVCKAVQHAHQKGIIHRDIKPSNVMITLHDGVPVPKIIDFGIAKATGQRLTEKTLFTRYAHMIGTPAYMSPEQAEMSALDVDTRSDIYSLGVLLYELLTGATPFDAQTLREAGYNEMQRIIREEEPDKPSTKLSSLGEALADIAKHRRTEPDSLTRLIRGDLDWVVMKTLEKDRTRRYETANELARDIERHLGDEPVTAGPPSTVYRLSKFIRRNRALVTAVSAVAAAIIVGLVVSTAMYFQAEKARDKETVARGIAEEARTAEAKQRHIAEEETKRAKELAETQRKQLYFNRIALADVAYRDGNISRLRGLLEACPEDLRGWEWYRLNHISDQSIMTLRGHQDVVYSVAISPDGKYIASGSNDKTIKVWDAATGAELITLRGHEDKVGPVSFSPDGRRIVSGSMDKTIKVWDAATGTEVMTLRGHDKAIHSVAFSPDGKRIVSGSWDKTIKVWDVASGTEILTLHGHEGSVTCAVFAPDGKRIISCSRTVKVWNATTGEELMTLREHDNWVDSIAFSPDGKRIISGSGDNTIKVWDSATGAEVMTLRGHGGWIRSVAFSPDGERIVSGGDDNVIKVWDAPTGEELMTLRGHEGGIGCAVFSPDGRRIVTGSSDNTIRVWDATIDREVKALIGHQGNVLSVAFSPEGRQIVSGSTDKTVKVWDVATGSEVMTLHGHQYDTKSSTWNPVTSVAFSPDAKSIVSGAFDRTIKLWDAASGAELMTLCGHEGEVDSLAFSPDGTRIVSASYDKTVKLWDTASGAELITLRGHDEYVTCVAFTPDSKHIVSGSWDATVKVWDAGAGTELMTLNCGKKWVNCVSVSPDSRRIASGSGDGTVEVWDVETGTEVMTLSAHKDEVVSVAFSRDGKRIASGSYNTVKIWDATSGTELMTLQGHGANSVAFSPDGKTVATGSDDDNIRLWESAAPTGGYGPRRTGAAATEVVDGLYEKHGFYHKVIDELKADETLDEAVRKVALQIANARLWEDGVSNDY